MGRPLHECESEAAPAGRRRLGLTLPRDEDALEVAHQKIESIRKYPNDDNTHYDHIAGEKLRRVKHHEAKTAGRPPHLSGNECGPPDTDADAHTREDLRQCCLHDDVPYDLRA